MPANIRPFTVEVPERDLKDLHARLAAARLPEQEPSMTRRRAYSS